MHTVGALFCLAFFLTLCGTSRVESACQDHPMARGLLSLAYAAEADAIIQGCKSPHKHLRVKQLSEGWRLDELVSLLPPLIPLSVRHPLGRFGS